MNNFYFSILILFIFSPIIGVAAINSLSVFIGISGIIIFILNKKRFKTGDNFINLIYVFLISIIISSLFSNFFMDQDSQILILKYLEINFFDNNLPLFFKPIYDLLPYFLYIPFVFFFFNLLKINTEKFLYISFASLILIFLLLLLFLIYEFYTLDKFIGDENFRSLFSNKVLGLYSVKFYPILLGLTLYFFNKTNNKYLMYILILYFFIFLILIVSSNQRTSLFLFIFTNLLILLKMRKKLFIYFLLTLTISLSLFNYKSENKLFDRYILSPYNEMFGNDSFNIFSGQYNAHYVTSINMFIENPLYGIGANNFKYLCNKENYEYVFRNEYNSQKQKFVKENGCTTHPHNIFIQILSEFGLFSFLLFFIMYIYLIIDYLRLSYNKSHILYFTSLVSLLVIFFPLIPTLSFFNSWSNSLNFFILSIFLHFKYVRAYPR